jgi:hypothetical protein
MEKNIIFFKKDSNSIKAVSINDLDSFSLYCYPTEEELKIIYSSGFILRYIIPKTNYTKYIYVRNDLMEVL